MTRDPIIFVYGDSLVLPRHPDAVEAGDTYAELFAAHYRSAHRPTLLYNRGESGKTIMDHWSKYKDDMVLFGTEAEDILMIHAGTVDCAPRPLPPRYRRKLERKPEFIRRPIVKFLKEHRPLLLSWGMSFRKVEPDRFRPRLREWLADASKRFQRVAVIDLPPVNTAAEEHSPGWQASVTLYNQIFTEEVAALNNPRLCLIPLHQRLWSCRDQLDSFISPADGHHLLKAGHQAVFEVLREALNL